MPLTQPPPEPDLIAQRGTDQWRDAVHAKKQWIAYELTHGTPLDELVDKYGEGGSPREGRLSHDYEYWQKALRGEELGNEGLPSELGDANWDIGNFRRQISVGDWTEWPPGSGQFFNDPANDSRKRVWKDAYGSDIPPPRDGGPDIDYNNMIAGETPAQYLQRRQKEVENEKKTKPITPTGPAQQQQQQQTNTQLSNPINYNPQTNNMYSKPPQQTSPNRMMAMTGQRGTQLPTRFPDALTGGPNTPFSGRKQAQPKPRSIGQGWYSTWS